MIRLVFSRVGGNGSLRNFEGKSHLLTSTAPTEKYRMNRRHTSLKRIFSDTLTRLAKYRARVVHVRDRSAENSFRASVFALIALFCFGKACYRPDDYVQFRNLPEDQQKLRFKQLPLDKQIDYYLLDQNHEPPRMDFDEDIAIQGKTVLAGLLQRLTNEPAEYRQRDLIWVIEVMHRKYEPLNTDQDVIQTVERVISNMKNSGWQQASRKSLDVIRMPRNTSVPRPSAFPPLQPQAP